MKISLDGKVVIVTGGSRGIGRAIVLQLANVGATVVFTYASSENAAEILVKETDSLKGTASAMKTNARDIDAANQLVENVVEQYGKVDICVNNAGIAKDNLLMRLSVEQWKETIETNLTSVYALSKAVIRPMMKGGGGSIINMSSIIGIRGNAGQSAYAASKAGIIGFTKSLALELGSRNIRCNCIAPGFVETDMTKSLHESEYANTYLGKIPLKRFAKPEEIANIVTFLSSNVASYITGQTISICGGLNI